jgi:hypothetical protein
VKTLEQVLADVERRLARTWAVEVTDTSAAAGESAWPHAFPLGQPTGATLADDFVATAQAAATWRTFANRHGVALRLRSRRVSGTDQELPTHVVVPDVDAAARLVAGAWQDRLVRGRRRAAVLANRYPRLTDPARMLAAVDTLTDVDFDLTCRAADWFATHDETGLTPRQVPIEGLHAKWLNTRQHLVRELAGVHDLRLAPPHPARLHFTYLDPEHRRSGGRVHDSATVGDAVTLAYLPDVVIISENKDTAIHFLPLPGAVSVEGVGRGGATAAAFTWLVSAPLIIYWGDMDADGLEILDGFRAAGVPAHSILMDLAAYEAWEPFGTNTDVKGRLLEGRERRHVPHLTPAEAHLYAQLTSPDWTRPRRIEQERIPLAVASAAVEQLRTEAKRALLDDAAG